MLHFVFYGVTDVFCHVCMAHISTASFSIMKTNIFYWQNIITSHFRDANWNVGGKNQAILLWCFPYSVFAYDGAQYMLDKMLISTDLFGYWKLALCPIYDHQNQQFHMIYWRKEVWNNFLNITSIIFRVFWPLFQFSRHHYQHNVFFSVFFYWSTCEIYVPFAHHLNLYLILRHFPT